MSVEELTKLMVKVCTSKEPDPTPLLENLYLDFMGTVQEKMQQVVPRDPAAFDLSIVLDILDDASLIWKKSSMNIAGFSLNKNSQIRHLIPVELFENRLKLLNPELLSLMIVHRKARLMGGGS